MKKIFYFIVGMISIILFPIFVNATDKNSNVCDYTKNASCSNFQDDTLKAEGVVYFSHRIYSECDGVHYKTPVYTNPEKKVVCSNGNSSPYTKLIKSGCPEKGVLCGSSKFCSIIVEYNCDLTSSGAKYNITTKTKKPTNKPTSKTTVKTTEKTTESTTPVKSNTKLKSLTLSSGNINFNSETFSYNIKVDSSVNNINVSAIPEDSTSKVNVTGNNDIKNGSIIKIVVTGADNSVSTYIIKVEKDTYIKSNNAKLKSLSIEGYTINFNSKVYDYPLIVDKDTKELSIDYETDNENASVYIEGNENIENGSKISIIVKAEDDTTNTYTISITKKSDSNFISILFIIILILAILAGAYYLYKKFILSKKGEKYEYE